MLEDVLDAVRGAGVGVVDVLTPSPGLEVEGASVLVSSLGLNDALNEYLAGAAAHGVGEVLIVMSDLPLARPRHLKRLMGVEGDVVIAPGKLGGTNVMLVREPGRFRVDYYGTSFLDHLEVARGLGLRVSVCDSFALAVDIDTPLDLVEILVHNRGRSRACLEAMGVKIAVRGGRVEISRVD